MGNIPSGAGAMDHQRSSHALAMSSTSLEVPRTATILRHTQPSSCLTLHQTVQAGGCVRAWSLVSATTGPETSPSRISPPFPRPCRLLPERAFVEGKELAPKTTTFVSITGWPFACTDRMPLQKEAFPSLAMVSFARAKRRSTPGRPRHSSGRGTGAEGGSHLPWQTGRSSASLLPEMCQDPV